MAYKILLLAILVLVSSAHAADDVTIPKGVNYKKTTDAINDQAIQKIRQVFSAKAADKDVLAFFEEKVLICGPGLWREIKDEPAIAKLTLGQVTLQLPVHDANGKVIRTDQLEGRLFQSDENVLAFWKVFAQKMDFTDYKIRKLTAAELEIYWAMISFDIAEPVFMVENKNHKNLVQFTSPEKMRVMWIDDYQHVSMDKPAKAKEPEPGK
ncbi:MAG TPA: hypothetical protein VFE47_11045 [Tepidisphaeraceae bacterium]|jgi:hypothetical protein|nr:hypothetical protein [Tepidisphaeraceae bacterium]